MTIEAVVLAVLLGLIPAFLAQRKGYNFLGWWVFGTLVLIVALPWAIFMGENPETRQPCPWCRTVIDKQARVCPQCGRDVHEFYGQGLGEPPKAPDDRRPWERE